jgi:ATP/maltotriose-dependent transcriptional regulator MalT
MDRRNLLAAGGALVAAGVVGGVEMSAGRYDDALDHLDEARRLAERFDAAWLAAWCGVQLGILAIARGRLDEARTLLDEALRLSVEARSTWSVSLCLGAFARLALIEGDAERAALLAGAAEGLRGRVGLRVWPALRGDADLAAGAREALGADRFDEAFAAGGRLNRREAVAAVGGRRGAGASTS